MGAAFNALAQAGISNAERQAAYNLSDKEQEHQQKIHDLIGERTNLISKIPTFTPGTPEYQEAHDALQGVNLAIADAFHPQKNPGAIQKFGHILTDHLGLTKPQPTATMVNPRAKGLVEAGNINIWNRPTVDNGDGTHSTEYSTSFQDENGHEVLVPTVVNGKFLTPDGKKPQEGSDAEKSMFHAAWEHYKKTGENLGKFDNPKDADIYAQVLHNRGAAVPKNIQDQLAKEAASLKLTNQQIAAAPLSDAQRIQAQIKQIKNSGLDEEEQKRAMQRVFGITPYTKPNWQQFKLPTGELRSFDLNNPESVSQIPEGATEVQKGAVTASSRQHEAFLQYQKDHPDYKGTEIQWVAEQRRLGTPSTSAINEGREDYSRSHGFNSWNDIPNEYRDTAMNYMIKKQAMDKAYPTATTTTSLKQNFQGQWVPVTETNYKTPEGAQTLRDPLWFLAAPVPGPNDAVQKGKKGGSSSSASSVLSPKELKKQAASLAPKSSKKTVSSTAGEETVPPSGRSYGNVRVGNPVFAAPSKDYRDALAQYNGAIARVKTMENSAKDALKSPPDQQSMLSLVANHIGMTLGAQKGARINQAVWNEAVESAPWLEKAKAKFDPNSGFLSGVTLTPQQIRSMVKLAHEQEDVFKENVETIRDQLNSGVANPSPSQIDGRKTPSPASNKALPPGW